MFRWSIFTLAALSALLCAVSSPAGFQPTSPSWPQFRGPNRDDISPDKGLLQAWPKDGPALLWKHNGVGGGYSSVTMTGNKVFTLGNRGSDTYAYALDRNSGNQLWETKIGVAGGNL